MCRWGILQSSCKVRIRGERKIACFQGSNPAFALGNPPASLSRKQHASRTWQPRKPLLVLTQPDQWNCETLNSVEGLPEAPSGQPYLFLLYKKTKTARQVMPSIRTTGASVRKT